MIKRWWKSFTIATIISGLVVFGDVYEFARDLWFDYNLSTHSVEVQKFEDESAIIDHRFQDGKLYLKYKTCYPPLETPEYYYIVWIDGIARGDRRPANGHFSIDSWFKPIQCTEGWWGQIGFDGADLGSEVVVTWYWKLDDGSYQQTNMRYIVR